MNVKTSIITAALILNLAHMVHANSDQAIKAFFGLRSCVVKIAPLQSQNTQNPIWYVFAIAKFENGKFLGYGHIGGGVRSLSKTSEENGELELLWGKRDGKMGYVMTWPLGSEDFKEDSFFADMTYFSSGGETGMPIIEKYEGFEIQSFAAVPPAVGIRNHPISPEEGNVMANISQFSKVVLLLYQEFPNQQEYLKWIESHKKMDEVKKQ